MDTETTLALTIVGGAVALTALSLAVAHARRPYAQIHAVAKTVGASMLKYRDFIRQFKFEVRQCLQKTLPPESCSLMTSWVYY